MRNIGEREREEVTKENGNMGVSLLGISRSQDSQCVEGMKGIYIYSLVLIVAIIVIVVIIVVYDDININSSN